MGDDDLDFLHGGQYGRDDHRRRRVYSRATAWVAASRLSGDLVHDSDDTDRLSRS
jgi:hypothetical protein